MSMCLPHHPAGARLLSMQNPCQALRPGMGRGRRPAHELHHRQPGPLERCRAGRPQPAPCVPGAFHIPLPAAGQSVNPGTASSAAASSGLLSPGSESPSWWRKDDLPGACGAGIGPMGWAEPGADGAPVHLHRLPPGPGAWLGQRDAHDRQGARAADAAREWCGALWVPCSWGRAQSLPLARGVQERAL